MKKLLLVFLMCAAAVVGASAQTCVGTVAFQLYLNGSWQSFNNATLDASGNYTTSIDYFTTEPVGSYQVQAVYVPTSGPCLASTSSAVTVTVTSSTGPSTTTLNIAPNPLVQGSGDQTFSGSVTLAGNSPAKVTIGPSAAVKK